jgi:hypothetical protein
MKWLKPHEVTEPGFYIVDVIDVEDPVIGKVYMGMFDKLVVKSTTSRYSLESLSEYYRFFGPIVFPTE